MDEELLLYGEKKSEITLEIAHYIPALHLNLILWVKMNKKGINTIFAMNYCNFSDRDENHNLLGHIRRRESHGLYSVSIIFPNGCQGRKILSSLRNDESQGVAYPTEERT